MKHATGPSFPEAKGFLARAAQPVKGRTWHDVLTTLARFYKSGAWRVPVLRERGADPFLVLVSTLLSHRTRDEVTARVTLRLLAAYHTPTELARSSLHRVHALIREVGLSRSKAEGLLDAARTIVSEFGGQVPFNEADLMRIPRVGPKTAHAVRVFGFKQPGIPVDTHILRVANRMGVVRGSTISEAQGELAEQVPKRYWRLLNPVLVQHGMNICTARAPRCGICPIGGWCLRIGVATPRSHRLVDSGRSLRRPRASSHVPASNYRSRRERRKVD